MTTRLLKFPSFGTLLIAGTVSWVGLCGLWLFFGSGYQFVQPEAYRLTTHMLLSNPATTDEASKVLLADGYLSIFDQNRMISSAKQ